MAKRRRVKTLTIIIPVPGKNIPAETIREILTAAGKFLIATKREG